LAFKLKHIRRFLGEGNKCKLVIVFRGREIVHPETGQAMLDQVVKACLDTATVEQKPIMEGRRMVMIIGARAGVIRPASGPGAAAPSAWQGDQGGATKASETPAAPTTGPRFGAPIAPQKP
jgi:translation initiation factor IF-3